MTDLARDEMLRLLAILSKEEKRLESGKLDRYVPHPKQLAFHKSKAKVRLMLGGNRCLAGETKIFDPVNDRMLRIDEIAEPFFVFAWNGDKLVPARATTPFVKGVDDLYRVKFSDGNEIVCTLKHKLLTPEGYVEVQKLREGSIVSAPDKPSFDQSDISLTSNLKSLSLFSDDELWPMESIHTLGNRIQYLLYSALELFGQILIKPTSFAQQQFLPYLQVSSLGYGQSIHALNDLSFYQTTLNSLKNYFSYPHPYDEQLLAFQGIGQAFVPSLADVQGHISHAGWDVMGKRLKHNHFYQLYDRHSNLGGLLQSAGRFAGSLFQTFYKQLRYAFGLFRVHCQSIHEFSRFLSNSSTYQLAKQSSFSLSPPSSSMLVTSIEYERKDVYYDLSVPDYGNYYACGTIQKNSGKTTSNLIECVWTALGIHPYNPIPVPNRGKMYGDSFSAVMETFVPKFEEWCPPEYFDPKKPFEHDQRGNVIGVNFKNGSRIIVGSYDQEDRKAEGSRFDYISFDEPPSRELYIANMRGLIDTGGRMWFSLTPISQAWLKDDIFDPGISGEKPYIECFNMRSDENPHIDHDALGLFLSELTDAEKEVRFHGHFAKLTGVVIDTYDAQIHDIEPFALDENYIVYEGIDPHPMKPHCALWKAVSRDGLRYVVDELAFTGGLYDFGTELVKKRKELTRFGARIGGSVIDTIINTTEMANRIDMRAELVRGIREAGGGVLPTSAFKRDQLNPGIEKIKDLYRIVDRGPILGKGPMQFVFKTCKKYKYELTHYQWPDNITDISKPKPINDDYIACERYLETINPTYTTPGKGKFLINNSGAYRKVGREDSKERGTIYV